MHARLLGLLAAALLLPATAASAAQTQELTFQDDDELIFSTPERVAATLDELAVLGVDRVRVSVFWATVAPAADQRSRPAFDAADPGAYPTGAWDRYDQVVRLAQERGIAVGLNLTSPAPLWATASDPPRPELAPTWQPSAEEFGRFARAVGTRYGGGYVPGTSSGTPADDSALCRFLRICSAPPAPPAPAGVPLPRVEHFSLWNEPNQPGWLTPQWVGSDQTGWVPAAPRLYRALATAAHAGLTAAGQGSSTILVGEMAPKGLLKPGTTAAVKALQFFREVFCVDRAYRPYTGEAARVRACPEDGTGFAAAFPGLLQATGVSHHPYSLTTSPIARPTDDDFVTLGSLTRLTRAMQRIWTAHGAGAPPPLHLTEFGYNTRPPNPLGVTLAGQARLLDQSEFLARRNAFVRTSSQFLLIDSEQGDPGSPGYSVTFQTGLRFADGRAKPSLASFRLPVWLPTQRVTRGRSLRVWGLVRPARRIGRRQRVTVELTSGGRTRRLRTATTAPSGVVDLRVRVPRSGTLRLAWTDPRTRDRVRSRKVPVTVRRAR